MAVMKSIMAETRIRPRVGWVRADQARSEEDIQRERQLTDELRDAQAHISDLEREIRDRSILEEDVPRELLAKGDDIVNLTVTFIDNNKEYVSEEIGLTWNEILVVIGQTIYGFIHRKGVGYGQSGAYPFQNNIEEHIRAKLIKKVQGRKIKIEASQIDSLVFQFKELGLLRFAEKENEDGTLFRGVTLTEEGERQLSLLTVRRRPSDQMRA
jgi:hypothetical protein